MLIEKKLSLYEIICHKVATFLRLKFNYRNLKNMEITMSYRIVKVKFL